MVGKLKNLNLDVESISELNSQSISGNLEKWVGSVRGYKFYIKANSTSVGRVNYECESEYITCRLAKMLGIK